MRTSLEIFRPTRDLFWAPKMWDAVVDDFLGATETKNHYVPAVDVTETEKAYLVSLDVPGLSKEEIKIELLGDQLKISGERATDKDETNKKYHVIERSYGRFERTIQLPDNIDSDKVEALHENGVLKIALPKTEAAKPKVIDVKADASPTGFFSKLVGKQN